MKSKEGFVQAYNSQAAVDAEAQIIVAHELTRSAAAIRANWCPWSKQSKTISVASQEQASADSGYCSEPTPKRSSHVVSTAMSHLDAPSTRPRQTLKGGPLTQLMRKKIDDGGFETPYRLRKQVVEPAFGQIK